MNIINKTYLKSILSKSSLIRFFIIKISYYILLSFRLNFIFYSFLINNKLLFIILTRKHLKIILRSIDIILIRYRNLF